MNQDSLSGKRVMVVEDEVLVAMLIEDMLLDSGCEVIGPFANLNDALAGVDDPSIELAVLDVNLRGEKIYPVAERLEARGIPFLLLSGYGEDAVPPDRKGWRVASKPFDTEVIIRTLSDMMAKA